MWAILTYCYSGGVCREGHVGTFKDLLAWTCGHVWSKMNIDHWSGKKLQHTNQVHKRWTTCRSEFRPTTSNGIVLPSTLKSLHKCTSTLIHPSLFSHACSRYFGDMARFWMCARGPRETGRGNIPYARLLNNATSRAEVLQSKWWNFMHVRVAVPGPSKIPPQKVLRPS